MSLNLSDELTCNPIDTFCDLMKFVKELKDPPPWRSLCKELTPHSALKINNMDIHNHKHEDIYLDEPETFCHINPDADDPPRTEAQKLPRTLVCHDMANGYHDDSYVDGTGKRNAYTFYNWAGIDIFCYFSHHLITIPPLGWINVGHAHGVKVIGTVITEWAEGVKFWDEVLESETMFQNTASALVAIAKTLKFDGWLLNIENKISHPKLLVEFVQHFRYILHQEIPHAELIWYDSVTIDGHLNWQNGLNDKNKVFFHACDGFFTNYSWTEFDITTSAIEAGDRLTDLFIGIDVWGRNFYGGGKLNTSAAIKVAHEEGCSLAIFAPAWTHEAMSSDVTDLNYIAMSDNLDKGQRWLLRDRALWGSFWPYLTTRLPCTLPFKTSFCRGQGKKRRMYGEVISRTPWYNLRHQQYQPNSAHGPHGYVISTSTFIQAVSTNEMYKDTKGILRIRDSFQATRAELLNPIKKEEHYQEEQEQDQEELEQNSEEQSIEVDKTILQIDRNAVDRASTDSTSSKKTVLKQKPPPKKRTCKDCITDLFKPKQKQMDRSGSRSTSFDESTIALKRSVEETDNSGGAGTSSKAMKEGTGTSLVNLSVNLRLGQGACGPATTIALAAVPQERECIEVYQDDSFNGGSCLRVHPSDEVCHEHRYTRLFHCDFIVHHHLVVIVVTKNLSDEENQYLTVRLHTVAKNNANTRVVLTGRDIPLPEHEGWSPAKGGVLMVVPIDTKSTKFKEVQKHLLLNQTGYYVPIENYFGWQVRYYLVDQLAGYRVTSVNLRTGNSRGSILLGHFALCNKPADTSS